MRGREGGRDSGREREKGEAERAGEKGRVATAIFYCRADEPRLREEGL